MMMFNTYNKCKQGMTMRVFITPQATLANPQGLQDMVAIHLTFMKKISAWQCGDVKKRESED